MTELIERLLSQGPSLTTQPLLLVGGEEERAEATRQLLRAWTEPPERPIDLVDRTLVWDRDAGSERDPGRWPVTELLHTLTLSALAPRGAAISVVGASADTQTALLKTLEEPPDQTRIVLAAGPHTPVLGTVRSRCAVVTLPAPTSDELLTWATEQAIRCDAATVALCPDRRTLRHLAADPTLCALVTEGDSQKIARAFYSADRDQRASWLHAVLPALGRAQPQMTGRCADASGMLDRGARPEVVLGLLLL